MSVSRRLRFEILRRDNHTCRYCGAHAPDVHLAVDHVIPQALGGSDDPTNLVAACVDCNSGKSSVPPDATVVADVAQDAVRWARAMKMAQSNWIIEQQLLAESIDLIGAQWDTWKIGDKAVPRDPDWRTTVDRWIGLGLSDEVLVSLIEVAMRAHGVLPENRWRYYAGVVWARIDGFQKTAKQIVERSAALAAEERNRP